MSILDHIVDGENFQRPLLTRIRASSKPALLYGAGVYAYVLRRFLAANDIEVKMVMVDRAYKVTDTFMGLPVSTTEEVGDDLEAFQIIVGITNFTKCVEKLRSLGATEVHVIDIPDYLNMPEPFMDFAFVKANIGQFDFAAELFADELSKNTYVASINTKINEDIKYVAPFVRLDNLYFPSSEFPLRKHEVLLDVGGFDGDTVCEFNDLTHGQYDKIISLEPDKKNYHNLIKTIESRAFRNVLPVNLGAWDKHDTLRFVAKEMHIDNQIADHGESEIGVDTIDAILEKLGYPVTLIKLDINGAENRALVGASQTIRKCRPRVIVRLHTKADYFQTPILLKAIAPDIKLYIRQRSFMSMMVILYGEFDSS
jgi:FkbM family methyltransferase